MAGTKNMKSVGGDRSVVASINYVVTAADVTADADVIAIDLEGVLPSDVTFATMGAQTAALYTLYSVPTADTVTVTTSGDTTAGDIIQVLVVRNSNG